jgi:hypothetical protein
VAFEISRSEFLEANPLDTAPGFSVENIKDGLAKFPDTVLLRNGSPGNLLDPLSVLVPDNPSNSG